MAGSDSELLTRLLTQMEHIRMESYEAETKAEERRLVREYGRLWKIVQPMLQARP